MAATIPTTTTPTTSFQQANGGTSAFQFMDGSGMNSTGAFVPPNTNTPVPTSQITAGALNLPPTAPSNNGSSLVAGIVGSGMTNPPAPAPTSPTPSTDMATTGDFTLDPGYQQAQNAYNQSVSQAQSATDALPSQATLLANAQQSTGANSALQTLNNLRTQLAASNARFMNAAQQAETGGINSGTPAVIYQGQQAAIQRQQAVESGALAVQMQAAQGNYDMAEKLAEQTAALQFSDAQNKIDNIFKFIQINQNNLSQAEKVAMSKMQVQAQKQQALLDTQKSNVQLALTSGVKTKFVNKNGEIFQSSDGKPFSDPQEFLKAAGVSSFEEAYQKGLITDLNGETLANMDLARQAQAAYPDVVIPPNATREQIAEAVKSSQKFQHENSFAPNAYSGGSQQVYVPGADPTVDAYITAVKNGNGTLANVPAAMRGIVAQGLAQGSQQTSIVDPQTDAQVRSIIAANPGEWGKAADAINKLLNDPNGATKYDSWLKGVYQQGQSPASVGNDTIYSPLAGSRFTMESNRIVSNFVKLPQYELTANGLPYLQRIQAAMQTPGSVSDQDLLDSLTKLNTAGNAITDAQVKLVTGGRSFADAVNTFQNKFKNGGVLSDSQRQQIQQIASAIYANYQKGYQPVYDQVTSQLKAAGIPESFWTIPNLNVLSNQGNSGGGGGQVIEYQGQQYNVDSQGNLSPLTNAGSGANNAQNQVKGMKESVSPMQTINPNTFLPNKPLPSSPKQINNIATAVQHYYPQGSTGGQCGDFVRSIASKLGLSYPTLGNSLSSKIQAVTKYGTSINNAKTGSVIVTKENPTYGHVAYIIGRNAQGFIVAESNYKQSNKVSYGRVIPYNSSKIVGVINPKNA